MTCWRTGAGRASPTGSSSTSSTRARRRSARWCLTSRGVEGDRDRLALGGVLVLEDLALMGRVSLHGLDEVGDQVVASLQLHVDAAPRFVDPVAGPDHAVAG